MMLQVTKQVIIFLGCVVATAGGFCIAGYLVMAAIDSWVSITRQGKAIFQFLRYRRRFFEWREEHPDAINQHGYNRHG